MRNVEFTEGSLEKLKKSPAPHISQMFHLQIFTGNLFSDASYGVSLFLNLSQAPNCL